MSRSHMTVNMILWLVSRDRMPHDIAMRMITMMFRFKSQKQISYSTPSFYRSRSDGPHYHITGHDLMVHTIIFICSVTCCIIDYRICYVTCYIMCYIIHDICYIRYMLHYMFSSKLNSHHQIVILITSQFSWNHVDLTNLTSFFWTRSLPEFIILPNEPIPLLSSTPPYTCMWV